MDGFERRLQILEKKGRRSRLLNVALLVGVGALLVAGAGKKDEPKIPGREAVTADLIAAKKFIAHHAFELRNAAGKTLAEIKSLGHSGALSNAMFWDANPSRYATAPDSGGAADEAHLALLPIVRGLSCELVCHPETAVRADKRGSQRPRNHTGNDVQVVRLLRRGEGTT